MGTPARSASPRGGREPSTELSHRAHRRSNTRAPQALCRWWVWRRPGKATDVDERDMRTLLEWSTRQVAVWGWAVGPVRHPSHY
ncbi:hypothetical protein PHLGIDRAFT_404564 [Phlebiopsis gigantea 11061_1 CR5-6]|uniref:Uncharacterized protein n=1 Tax=Phlebiopsis gigantea (strain 11061_1 CR5-6) TaxID=745531 RepID=A0A0C3SBD5_PHLG1|nr:hypothetical protein PHLGIDRAFT_404564 [Phlebiopsis gigantea 11061_1 CR5-6]